MAASSEDPVGPIYYAFDGNYEADFTLNSTYASVNADARPYITMDFGELNVISQVTITNRGDCCGKLSHYHIITLFIVMQ